VPRLIKQLHALVKC